MWQTAVVLLILAAVVIYVARTVVRMVRSKTPTCSGCIGCCGQEGSAHPTEQCDGQ